MKNQKTMIYIQIVLLALYLVKACPSESIVTETVELKPNVKALKAYTIDGDTQVYIIDDRKYTVRLLHIDTPEKNSYYSLEAKEFSNSLLNDSVTIIHDNKFDKYGRLLAEIKLSDNKILNKLLVKFGYARHFKKYSSAHEYSHLEQVAKNNKIGIWK